MYSASVTETVWWAGVRACGVQGVAVVSAVTQAGDPQAAVRSGLALAQSANA